MSFESAQENAGLQFSAIGEDTPSNITTTGALKATGRRAIQKWRASRDHTDTLLQVLRACKVIRYHAHCRLAVKGSRPIWQLADGTVERRTAQENR